MNRYRIVGTLVLVVSGLFTAAFCPPARTDEPAAKPGIIGTWRLVSYNYGGQGDLMPAPAETVALKHITPGHFEWVRYDAKTHKVTGTAGGRYTLSGNTYKETIEYGLGDDYDVIKDQEHSFTVRVEGDRLHQTGKLASGLSIDEIWERLK
jgi:hypothetical protein